MSQLIKFFSVIVVAVGVLAMYPDVVNPAEYDSSFDEMKVFSRHNFNNRYDVDNDGHVYPRDALIILNMLNTVYGGRPELNDPKKYYYYDVNRDGILSPIDLLLLINYLNKRSKEHSNEQRSEIDEVEGVYT